MKYNLRSLIIQFTHHGFFGYTLRQEQMGDIASSVDAYLEYRRIVGDDDRGKTFTPEEYERYKRRVLPLRSQNRLFVSWKNRNSGLECKEIGPETPCFCSHRYHQHQTDFEKLPDSIASLRLRCRQKGCKCASYHYIPRNIRCNCKHLPEDHSEFGKLTCRKDNGVQCFEDWYSFYETSKSCNDKCKCSGFHSDYACSCGSTLTAHVMSVETKEQRLATGKPVGHEVPYKAMGGITGFSSLIDGYMRLDSSGIGSLSMEQLNQPITDDDHPFLRINAASLQEYKEGLNSSMDHMKISNRHGHAPQSVQQRQKLHARSKSLSTAQRRSKSNQQAQ